VLEARMTRIDEQIKEHEQTATALKEERKQLETVIKNMAKG
jgi:cell division protein FtsB